MSTVGHLYRISGIGAVEPRFVDVDREGAAISFITLVSENAYGLKDLLKQYPGIVNTELQGYCANNGIDFEFLKMLLNE